MAAYHGYGYNKIARTLTQQKVITPAAYQAQRVGREYDKDPYEWNLATIYRMMENKTYLGHLISGKRRKLSYKSKKVVHQDEDQWIVVENQFPALISEQLWADAHKALGSRKRESKTGAVNIFAGLIKCEKCGYALGISNKSEQDNYFVCNTYKKKGSAYCSAHYIRYDELYNAVLGDLQKITASIHKNREACIQKIIKKLGADNRTLTSSAETEKEAIQKRLSELDRRFDVLYEDRLDGTITETKFRDIMKRTTKVIAVFTALLLMLSAIPITASAASWNISVKVNNKAIALPQAVDLHFLTHSQQRAKAISRTAVNITAQHR